MMKFIGKILKLFCGLFVVSLGVVFMLNANIGLPPWDVLHSGVSNLLNITIGQAIILISIILTLIGVMLGETIGIGTICNMLLVGTFVDIIKSFNLVPFGSNFISGFIILNIGMVLLAVGTVIYMSCVLGCGAKDAVTMGLTRKLNKPIKTTRAGLEILATIIGILIGGSFNIGTIYAAVVFGYFMQYAFKVFNCAPNKLNHISLIKTLSFSNN